MAPETSGIEAIVMGEVAEAKAKSSQASDGSHWTKFFYNNFFMKLPGRSMYEMIERYAPKKLDEHPNYNPSNPQSNFSELRRSQTLREFQGAIDSVLRDSGLDIELIKRLNLNYEFDRLGTYILPVYIKLRELGYSSYPDLTA